jgi:hypothetical protein
MRSCPFITRKRNAKPVAKRRCDKMQLAPASRTQEIVPGDERGAGNADRGEKKVSGILQAAGREPGYILKHLQHKQK